MREQNFENCWPCPYCNYEDGESNWYCSLPFELYEDECPLLQEEQEES